MAGVRSIVPQREVWGNWTRLFPLILLRERAREREGSPSKSKEASLGESRHLESLEVKGQLPEIREGRGGTGGEKSVPTHSQNSKATIFGTRQD